MQFENYPYVKTEEIHYYEFNSKGPKGIVKKVVCFNSMHWRPIPMFNLSFGDRNENTSYINDRVATNNQDRKKVLATVAATVLDFMRERPGGCIYAEGSTPARTRLYQMGISIILHQIKDEFDVYGNLDGIWHSFKKGVNYNCFLLANKKSNFDPNKIILL